MHLKLIEFYVKILDNTRALSNNQNIRKDQNQERRFKMWFISIFDAKENTSRTAIINERAEWVKKGLDKIFQQRCKSIKRFEVLGSSPRKIFFVIETDDPTSLNLLSNHFEDAWNSITYPIIQREIAEALDEDHAVIGG